MKSRFLITLLVIMHTYLIDTVCSQTKDSNNPKYVKEMETNKKLNLKNNLTPLQYHVTQENGTERPFTGEYWDNFKKGTYHCIVCDTILFESNTKFESGCGWPSFYDVTKKKNFVFTKDLSHGMERIEVRCANCDSHLGHVFNDGPKPTGLRYCINSVSLRFKSKE